MKRYFLLRTDSDPKVLGVDDGVKQAEIKKDGFCNPEMYDLILKSFGSNHYWSIKDSLGELKIELQCVEMLPEAKLTDFLQFSPMLINCPFLISERIASMLQRFNLCMHYFFHAAVKDRMLPNKYNYYLPYFEKQDDQIIDYEKSLFYTGTKGLAEKYISFSSADQKKAFQKTNSGLRVDTLFLYKNFDASLDLFVFADAGILISEHLKVQLDAVRASGVKLLPAYGDDVRWVKIISS